MKKYLPAFLYTFSICLIGSFLSCCLYYFNITNDKINTALIYLTSITSIFVGSFIIGKKTNNKAIIAGTLYFLILFSFIIFFSFLIFKFPIKASNIIYFIIIYIFGILGTIIGKNNKKEAGIN